MVWLALWVFSQRCAVSGCVVPKAKRGGGEWGGELTEKSQQKHKDEDMTTLGLHNGTSNGKTARHSGKKNVQQWGIITIHFLSLFLSCREGISELWGTHMGVRVRVHRSMCVSVCGGHLLQWPNQCLRPTPSPLILSKQHYISWPHPSSYKDTLRSREDVLESSATFCPDTFWLPSPFRTHLSLHLQEPKHTLYLISVSDQ